MDIYCILRKSYCHLKTSASPATLLVLLLSAVLLGPVIPVPHSGPFLGLRVLLIQAAAIAALVLVLSRASSFGGRLKSIIVRGPGIPLVLLLAWTALSFLLTAPANAHGRGIAQVELLRIGMGAALYVAAVYGCRSRFQVRTMSLLLMGGAMLAAAAGIVTSSPMLLKPARGAFGEEQLMGAFLATLLPVAVTFALKDIFAGKGTTSRVIKAVGAIVVLCVLLLTAERMSWISGMAGSAVALALAVRMRMIKVPPLEPRAGSVRYWSVPLAAIGALVCINLAFMCFVPVVHHRLEAVQTKVSVQSRFTLWSACAEMIRQKPLTGWGVGSFPLKAGDYISTVPTAAQVEKQGVTLSSIAHNEYLQLGAELGMVGLGLYLAVILGFFVHTIRALKQSGSPSRRWLILASIAGVASQSINALTNPGWHFSDVNPLLWLLMGMGMAAAMPHVTAKPRQMPHKVHAVIKPLGQLPQWPRVAQSAFSIAVGISLVLASASVSLGKGTALSYYYYGALPIITSVTATPNPLPAGGGTLQGQASIADGGAGVSNVYAYLYRDASYYASLSLGSGPGIYSPNFTIPANSSAAAHSWNIEFLAYNFQGYAATASASSTQPATGPATLNVPSTQYPTIQSGVDAAQDGNTVLVADGIYTGPGNRDIDFGGKSITVASKNGPGKTIIDCGGSASADGSGNHRGFYLHRGEISAAISGFTIKNGYEAYSPSFGTSGGSGIYDNITDGTITLTNCIVSGNRKSDGGIYNRNTGTGTIKLINCAVTDNEGSGIINDNFESGTITLTNCTVSGNNTTYAGNNPIDIGGGVCNLSHTTGGTIALTNCTISGNIAFNGGGICNAISGGTITVAGCVISANAALGHNADGGGVFNSIFGGAIILTNCTISGNKASNSGSGISNSRNGGTITLTNDLVFGDTNSEISNLNGATPIISYSDIQGGYPGTGNINADPMFVNVATGNFYLQAGSPCVGKGTASDTPSLDKDGRTRPNPPSMGAYELTQILTVPAQFSTIQAGITAAKSGDTVAIASGTYTGPGNVDYDFGGKGIIVKSQNGPAQTIIDCGGYPSSDGSGNHRAFYLHSGETGAAIDGFTIKNGYTAPVPGVPDSGFGGGLCIDGADATVSHCVFSGNTATSGGGYAILGNKHHSITITNAVFTQNTAKIGGGGYIEDTGGKVAVVSGKITGNTADSGTGFYVKNTGGTDSFIGCLVSGNKGNDDGGGFHLETDSGDSTIAITNCSVSGNASPLGADMYTEEYAGSTITLLNDIFYSSVTNEIFTHSGPAPVATYSDIRGGYPGIGNIDKDPLFVSVPNDDLHLKVGSPCLGAGTPDGAPSTDLDGNPRPNLPSMGAYELISSTLKISDVKLTIPQFINAGHGKYYLDEKVYFKGIGSGTVTGHWVVAGSSVSQVNAKRIDVSSGYWTEGAEIKLPWETIKASNFNIKFSLETPNAIQTPETAASVTGFRPDVNGWAFTNNVSTIYTIDFLHPLKFDGVCTGMAATAHYYYQHQPLPSLLSIRRIRTEIRQAFNSGNDYINKVDVPRYATYPNYNQDQWKTLNETEAGKVLPHLQNLDPTLIGLFTADWSANHALLATAGFSSSSMLNVDNSDFGPSNIEEVRNAQDFAVYDPNFPNEFHEVYVGDVTSGVSTVHFLSYINTSGTNADSAYNLHYAGFGYFSYDYVP